jgi:hypothetical protein
LPGITSAGQRIRYLTSVTGTSAIWITFAATEPSAMPMNAPSPRLLLRVVPERPGWRDAVRVLPRLRPRRTGGRLESRAFERRQPPESPVSHLKPPVAPILDDRIPDRKARSLPGERQAADPSHPGSPAMKIDAGIIARTRSAMR